MVEFILMDNVHIIMRSFSRRHVGYCIGRIDNAISKIYIFYGYAKFLFHYRPFLIRNGSGMLSRIVHHINHQDYQD